MMKPLNWRLVFHPCPGLLGVSEFVVVVGDVVGLADVVVAVVAAAVVLTLILLGSLAFVLALLSDLRSDFRLVL